MAERIVSTPVFFTWLKGLGLNLPENCTEARIVMDGPIVHIECTVIASMTLDAEGNLPTVTKRYKLVEDDGE